MRAVCRPHSHKGFGRASETSGAFRPAGWHGIRYRTLHRYPDWSADDPEAGGDLLPAPGSRDADAGPELPHLLVRRLRQAVAAALGRSRGTSGSSRATGSPRSAGTTTSTSRRTSASRAAARPAHAQPAPAPERPRLHRHARRRQGRHRRPEPAAAVGQFKDKTQIEHVFVVEDSLRGAARAERIRTTTRTLSSTRTTAAAMCYTSGTTGMPKGVLYSHRSTVLHTLGQALAAPLGAARDRGGDPPAGRADVPRERVGLPVHLPDGRREARLPGAVPRPESRCSTTSSRRSVTITAGVPTIWIGILGMLDAEPDRWDLSKLHSMLVGGSAAPRAMIEGFRQRHGKTVVHGWGMTETSPLATASDYVGEFRHADEETQLDVVAMQGLPLPFVELRAHRRRRATRSRGTARRWASSRCAGPGSPPATTTTPEQADRWTDDGWFKTGDIVTFDPKGYMRIKDRSKDVIKSGGEWISLGRARERADGAPGGRRGRGDRGPAREVGRAAARRLRAAARGRRRRRTSCARSSRRTSRSSGCRTRTRSSTRSRRRPSASSARRRCASSFRSARLV